MLTDGEGKSWLHKLGMNINKWSFLNSLTGWSEDRTQEKGIFTKQVLFMLSGKDNTVDKMRRFGFFPLYVRSD